MLRTRAESLAGIPVLRDIPLVNMFFGHKDASTQDRQVMIFITSHLWQPDLQAPIVKEKEWSIHDSREKRVESGFFYSV